MGVGVFAQVFLLEKMLSRIKSNLIPGARDTQFPFDRETDLHIQLVCSHLIN